VVVHNSTDECLPVRYCVVSQNPTLLVFPRCLVADTFRIVIGLAVGFPQQQRFNE